MKASRESKVSGWTMEDQGRNRDKETRPVEVLKWGPHYGVQVTSRFWWRFTVIPL